MYLCFDTETTGLPKSWKAPITDLNNWPRMVQLAWLQCDAAGEVLETGNYIIKPEDFEIPVASSNIHGITTQIAIDRGLPLKEVLVKFSAALDRASFLVAHNISFDEKIIGAEFIRQGITSVLFSLKQFCTKELSTDYCKLPKSFGGYKWPTLQELHTKLFGGPFEAAHDAGRDVAACKKCFFELKKLNLIESGIITSPPML
jgi:DNA polymerase-3 subunit epsilon